jgi:hypothetical protein
MWRTHRISNVAIDVPVSRFSLYETKMAESAGKKPKAKKKQA